MDVLKPYRPEAIEAGSLKPRRVRRGVDDRTILAVADARRMCLFADIKVESDGRSATIFFIRV